MDSQEVIGQQRGAAGFRRYFTPDEANRTLVFVRRVVQDIVSRTASLMAVRDEAEGLSRLSTPDETLDALRTRAERLAEELRRLHDELTDVGCELKDWHSGLVDFPARHNGRDVLLCWKLGEPSIAHWHDLEAGFAGRKLIESDF